VKHVLIRLLVAAVGLAGLLVGITASPALACPGHASANFESAESTCVFTAAETREFFGSGDGHDYAISLACEVGGSATCLRGATCGSTLPGQLYDVFRDGDLIGQTCLSAGDVTSLGQITPRLVRREFERLTWPSSELAVQPPDGVTLVGFESNFFTTNTTPTTQTVTLLGRRITIEATPTSYAWHFGDESTETTSTPGAAYPQLLVTHRYQHIGKVQPSVDTVYAGRYRVGTGPWRAIPGTLTVTGQQQELEVREARGVLVGH